MNELITTTTGTSLVISSEARVSREKAWAAMCIAMVQMPPRNITLIQENVVTLCQNRDFAEVAMYAYERGSSFKDGQWVKNIVTGPSVKLMREIKREYGFIDSGIDLNEMSDEVWIGEAYAIDIRTMSRERLGVAVKMQRTKWKNKDDHSKGKEVKIIDDERDQYENFANWSSRRERKALETILPWALIAAAVNQVKATMSGKFSDNTASTIQKGKSQGEVSIIQLLNSIYSEAGVTKNNLEKHLGKKASEITPDECVSLQAALTALRDGAISKSEFLSFFDHSQPLDIQPEAAAPNATPAPEGDKAKKPRGKKDASATTTPDGSATGTETTASEPEPTPVDFSGAFK